MTTNTSFVNAAPQVSLILQDLYSFFAVSKNCCRESGPCYHVLPLKYSYSIQVIGYYIALSKISRKPLIALVITETTIQIVVLPFTLKDTSEIVINAIMLNPIAIMQKADGMDSAGRWFFCVVLYCALF